MLVGKRRTMKTQQRIRQLQNMLKESKSFHDYLTRDPEVVDEYAVWLGRGIAKIEAEISGLKGKIKNEKVS